MQPRTNESRHRFALRSFWARLLAAFFLFVLTPGSADVIQDVVAFTTGVECCDEHCDSSEGCPRPCAHCVCCGHPSAVPAPLVRIPARPAPVEMKFNAFSENARSTGYRAPPFRPPTS